LSKVEGKKQKETKKIKKKEKKEGKEKKKRKEKKGRGKEGSYLRKEGELSLVVLIIIPAVP